MKKNTKYGVWIPDFPDLVLMASAIVRSSKFKRQTLHTFPRVFSNSEDMADYIESVLYNYRLDPEAEKIKFGPVYVSMLKYSRGVELKKEYWLNNTHTEFSPIRQTLFANMISSETKISDWQILVTPEGKRGKKHFFSAAMPFSSEGEKLKEEIEAFMLYSDWNVDPGATHAGLYSVVDEVVFNWNEKEIRKTKTKRS